jgi:hypothetical protein
MSKTIVSFDIGIKNLAFCVFSIDAGKTSVLKWNIVNLIQSDPAQQPSQCTCMKTSKKMSVPPAQCDKKGAFNDSDGKIYCNVHAKNSGKLLPSKEMSMTTIKTLKLEDLKSFCKTHLIAFAETDKKPDIIAKTQNAIQLRSLIPIKVVKKNANHIHLVEIGKQIKTQLDEILNMHIDIVILENQISPIAGRMNTIQGMLAQYFIMRVAQCPKIEFISSSGKLKDFASKSNDAQTTYKDHKRDGIQFCRNFMAKNDGLRKCQEVLETSAKKDDLADCFLQGIYYLKREKLITYSEDLEINGVSI